jgi:hypothetical protein
MLELRKDQHKWVLYDIKQVFGKYFADAVKTRAWYFKIHIEAAHPDWPGEVKAQALELLRAGFNNRTWDDLIEDAGDRSASYARAAISNTVGCAVCEARDAIMPKWKPLNKADHNRVAREITAELRAEALAIRAELEAEEEAHRAAMVSQLSEGSRDLVRQIMAKSKTGNGGEA